MVHRLLELLTDHQVTETFGFEFNLAAPIFHRPALLSMEVSHPFILFPAPPFSPGFLQIC